MTSASPSPRVWWRGPADPVLRTVSLLVLVLWPTVWVWVLPGLHREGSGAAFAWALVAVYSAAAVLLLGAGSRADTVLPVCLPMFALASAFGALAGPDREMALLVPLFLGVLCAIAALRLSRRDTWGQVAVSCAAGLVCVAWAAFDAVTFTTTAVAVVAGISAPAAAVLRLRGRLDAATAEATRLSRLDPLTGALNRRGLDEDAAPLLASGEPLVLVVLDLDGFKAVNDRYGHRVGDEVLRDVVSALRDIELDIDDDFPVEATSGVLVARLGGEEFVTLAPARDIDAEVFAERVRRAAAVEVAGGPERASGSVGALRCTPPAHAAGSDWLLAQIDRADELMYEAKRSGGDRALCAVG